jgi:hypothetical protein
MPEFNSYADQQLFLAMLSLIGDQSLRQRLVGGWRFTKS